MTYLARQETLPLEQFATACGLHPDLVRRFVVLGLLEHERHGDREIWFRRAQLTRVARLLRLRDDLSLNYAALGLVIELLDRIDVLEDQVRRSTTNETET